MSEHILADFEQRKPEIAPNIVETLEHFGDEAIIAYGSVQLLHNTLSSLVPSIVENGLCAGELSTVPSEDDISFARDLYMCKGYRLYSDNDRRFERYIAGTVDKREPGIFFYPKTDGETNYNPGYGIPERMHILCSEMGYVMINEQGRFNTAEQTQAATIHNKYSGIISGDPKTYIAVFSANPFSTEIINSRLARVDTAFSKEEKELAILRLSNSYSPFEGIYIAGSVPPEDLELLDVRIPLPFDPTKNARTMSRFYHVPAEPEAL